MPRMVKLTQNGNKVVPFKTKTKKAAQQHLANLKRANRDVVSEGIGTVTHYSVKKIKGGYTIYYRNTGKWRL